MTAKIKNAIVESVTIDDAERGVLNAWLHLDYGGSGQGFGGYALYMPKGFKNHDAKSGYAGHFIWRCMEIAGVTKWEKIAGKAIRAKIEDGLVVAVGHITKDDWFEPRKDWADQP
jgi:hypothetical protein